MSLNDALSLISLEKERIEDTLKGSRLDQRSFKTLDKLRSVLKSVQRDLEYAVSTLKQVMPTASYRNPLLPLVISFAKRGYSADEIAQKLHKEDAEVVGDAIVEAQRLGKLKKGFVQELIRLAREINAFRLGNKMGTGGGLIRPNGILIPVHYYGHGDVAIKEIEDRKLPVKPDENEIDAVKNLGYVIIHNTRSEQGWIIEYERHLVDKSVLKELLDYFIVNYGENFKVYNPTFHEARNTEELEQVFNV